jgi:hypothetical protein
MDQLLNKLENNIDQKQPTLILFRVVQFKLLVLANRLESHLYEQIQMTKKGGKCKIIKLQLLR